MNMDRFNERGCVRVWLESRLPHVDERAMYMYRTQLARMSLRCQLPASCTLAWAVQQFSDRRAHAQLSSVYLPSTARVGHVISEPMLPPTLAQFTSSGRREPGDDATEARTKHVSSGGRRGGVRRHAPLKHFGILDFIPDTISGYSRVGRPDSYK